MSAGENHPTQTRSRLRLCAGGSSSVGNAGAIRPTVAIAPFSMQSLREKLWTKFGRRCCAHSLGGAGTWEREPAFFATTVILILIAPQELEERRRGRTPIKSRAVLLPVLLATVLVAKSPKPRGKWRRPRPKTVVLVATKTTNPLVVCVWRCHRFPRMPRTGPATHFCQDAITSSAPSAFSNGGQPINWPVMMLPEERQHSIRRWSSAAQRVGHLLAFASHPTNTARARQRRR